MIFSSLNLLHVGFYFVKLVAWWFCSWNLLRPDFFVWNLIYLDILFVKLTLCCFFFRKIWGMLIFVFETHCIWIISSRNVMYLDLWLRETSCMYNFLHQTYCRFIFLFVKVVYQFIWFLHADFSLSKTFSLFILLLKPVLFIEPVPC